MSFPAAVAKRLAAQLDALTFTPTDTTGNVFLGHMPSSPDVAVAILPQPGLPQRTKAPTDLPVLQVLVRGPIDDFDAAETLAAAVLGDLNCLDHVTLDPDGDDETLLVGMTAFDSTAVHLGLDPNRRHEFVINLTARIHAPSTHRPAIQGA